MTEKATRSDAPEYVTMSELCRRLSISRSSVYRHSLLRYAIPFGRCWRFNWGDVLTYLQRENASTPPAESVAETILPPGTYRCCACGFEGNLPGPLPLHRMRCSCGRVGEVERLA